MQPIWAALNFRPFLVNMYIIPSKYFFLWVKKHFLQFIVKQINQTKPDLQTNLRPWCQLEHTEESFRGGVRLNRASFLAIFFKNGISACLCHRLIFIPLMCIRGHVLSTLRKLRAEQVKLLCRDVAMSQIATGKKKTGNQDFTCLAEALNTITVNIMQ